MLRYFGDNDSGNCGKCDICLNEKSYKLSNESIELISQKIKELVSNDKLSIREMVKKFPVKSHNTLYHTLDKLVENHEIEFTNFEYSLNSK
jgi:superfamily II DNA helicase RecQ